MKNSEDSLLEQQIVLAALPESLPLLYSTLGAFGQWIGDRLDLPSDRTVLNRLHMAAMEIATNIVEHAYPVPDPLHPLWVHMALFADRIELSLYDRGQSFDPVLLASPCLPDPCGQYEQGGWGLALASRALDQLSYRRREDGINEWRLVKRLTPP